MKITVTKIIENNGLLKTQTASVEYDDDCDAPLSALTDDAGELASKRARALFLAMDRPQQ